MEKNSAGEKFVLVLVVIGVFYFIGLISGAFESEPKCIKGGCDRKQESGSSYCYLHKPYERKSSTYSGTFSESESSTVSSPSSSSSESFSSTTNSYSDTAKENDYGTSNSKKNNTYDSYDDGYDDIYMDGDYDYDRYDNDSDYAEGVDDAMDEFGEER